MTDREPTGLTPAEIDTELAAIWGETAKLRGWLANTNAAVRRGEAGDRFYARELERNRARAAELEDKIAGLRDDARPYEAEYARRPWNRYFLVTNSNGHVHREMSCSTCHPTTEYAWLIDLADCDEKAMVEEWGEQACTVCFPAAPTNPNYHRPARVDREAKEARAAEKAERERVKAEKAITAPDGGPLRVPDGTYKNYRTGEIEMSYETIKTKVAASRALSVAIKDYSWYGPDHPSMFGAKIPILVEALEAAGIETKPIIERAKKAAAKDRARYEWKG